MHYLTNKELAKLIRLCKRSKRKNFPLLLPALDKLVYGLHSRYNFPVDVHELQAEFVLLVYTNIKKIDVTKNIFSWLTTCLMNLARQLMRDDNSHGSKLRKYYDQLSTDKKLELELNPREKR
jgi:DNA-directed RNA polymerase specialized sigma24 family protein